MVIELDMESEVPIYVQLRNQIVKGIGKGELKAQEKLPMKPGDYCIIVTGWHRLYSDSDRYFL